MKRISLNETLSILPSCMSVQRIIYIMGRATSSFTFLQVLVTVTDEDQKVLAKNSSAHLVLKFVREFQYQDMSVSCSRWASRMNLINFLQQQDIIIRWCCSRLSLALELGNLNCVTSIGGNFPCAMNQGTSLHVERDFMLGCVWAQVGRVKN